MDQRDITNVLDGVRGVISSLNELWLLWLLKIGEPFSWFVMWLEAPKSTYHTSFDFNVPTPIWLALCFITNAGLVTAHPEPLA